MPTQDSRNRSIRNGDANVFPVGGTTVSILNLEGYLEGYLGHQPWCLLRCSRNTWKVT